MGTKKGLIYGKGVKRVRPGCVQRGEECATRLCSLYAGPKCTRNMLTNPSQCRINNSSKCSNCYGPRVFGGPAVFCNKSYLLYILYIRYFSI